MKRRDFCRSALATAVAAAYPGHQLIAASHESMGGIVGDIEALTTGGQSVRIRAEEVRETGRAAQGVKLVTLKEGELLQDIARVVSDDEGGAVVG